MRFHQIFSQNDTVSQLPPDSFGGWIEAPPKQRNKLFESDPPRSDSRDDSWLRLDPNRIEIFVINLSWRGRGETTRARSRRTLFRLSGAGYSHFFRCYDAHVVPILMDASYVWYPSRFRNLEFL